MLRRYRVFFGKRRRRGLLFFVPVAPVPFAGDVEFALGLPYSSWELGQPGGD